MVAIRFEKRTLEPHVAPSIGRRTGSVGAL